MISLYKLAQQLYEKGYTKQAETVLAALPLIKERSKIKNIPFLPGQTILVEVKGGKEIEGKYIGTIQDSLLLNVGQPLPIPFDQILRICVFWID